MLFFIPTYLLLPEKIFTTNLRLFISVIDVDGRREYDAVDENCNIKLNQRNMNVKVDK